MHQRTAGSAFPLASLALLAVAVFLTVTAESLPAGMIIEMSRDLDVGIEEVGLLISVWALTVIVTSVPLARLTAALDRRLVTGAALAVFALANLATAIAPGYAAALGLRVAAAVAHGLFWAVVIVYATALLRPEHLGRGLAIVTGGGTAATVVGLPASTLLAQASTWRAAFAILGALALVIALVILRFMPSRVPPRVARAASGPRTSLRHDRSLPVLAVFGVASVMIATAQFACFTYIRPYLQDAVGVPEQWVAGLLLVYGLAGLGGVVVAGAVADRLPRLALSATLGLFAVALVALAVGSHAMPVVVVGMVVWGAALGAMFPLLQMTLMRVATDRTRTLASAGMIVFFNIGIALGPWLGGLVGGPDAAILRTAVAAAVMLGAATLGIVAVMKAVPGGSERTESTGGGAPQTSQASSSETAESPAVAVCASET
jgi:MFS transporter, DHA1 family, inner membrane transport protein